MHLVKNLSLLPIDPNANADPTLTITAKTAPEDNASTHILKRHGFRFIGLVPDHEIGDAWGWELPGQAGIADGVRVA